MTNAFYRPFEGDLVVMSRSVFINQIINMVLDLVFPAIFHQDCPTAFVAVSINELKLIV